MLAFCHTERCDARTIAFGDPLPMIGSEKRVSHPDTVFASSQGTRRLKNPNAIVPGWNSELRAGYEDEVALLETYIFSLPRSGSHG
jgi:hypothetical protein